MNKSFSINDEDELGLKALEIVMSEADRNSQSFSNVVRNLLVAEAYPELVNNKPKIAGKQLKKPSKDK